MTNNYLLDFKLNANSSSAAQHCTKGLASICKSKYTHYLAPGEENHRLLVSFEMLAKSISFLLVLFQKYFF